MTAKGRVSPSNQQMGTNFYIGNVTHVVNDILLRVRVPSLTLTGLNHGSNPNPNDSDISVYSSG